MECSAGEGEGQGESHCHEMMNQEIDYSNVKTFRCYQNTLQQISFLIDRRHGHGDKIYSHCCYLFHFPLLQQIFVWIGKKSNLEDSQLIEKVLPDLLIACRIQSYSIFRRLDDAPSDEFQKCLGFLQVCHDQPSKNEAIHVYHHSSPSNTLKLLAKFQPDSVSYSTKLPMSILDDQQTFVIECSLTVYIWVGSNSTIPSNIVELTNSFLRSSKVIEIINQGSEPFLFRILFHDWNPSKIIGSFSTSPSITESPSTPRRKSLVAERRKSFTQHNSVPDLSTLLPQRQGSFYTKQSSSEGHTKWSLVHRSSSDDHTTTARTSSSDDQQQLTKGNEVSNYSDVTQDPQDESSSETFRDVLSSQSPPTITSSEPTSDNLVSVDPTLMAIEVQGVDISPPLSNEETPKPVQESSSTYEEQRPSDNFENSPTSQLAVSTSEPAIENIEISSLDTATILSTEVGGAEREVDLSTPVVNEEIEKEKILEPVKEASQPIFEENRSFDKLEQSSPSKSSTKRPQPPTISSAPSGENPLPSTIPIHQKNQCFCM